MAQGIISPLLVSLTNKPLNGVFVFLIEMDLGYESRQLVHLTGIIPVIKEMGMGFKKRGVKIAFLKIRIIGNTQGTPEFKGHP